MFSSLSSSALNRRDAMKYAAFSITSAFLLSSCGVGTQNPAASSSASQAVVDEQSTRTVLENLADQLRSSIAPDQKALRGPNSAADTPEIQPMVDTPTPAFPVTFKDFNGTEVTVKSAERVLALDLYGTLAQQMIALNAEAILATSPDLVLWDKSNGPIEVVDQLRAAGVTVVVFDHERRMDKIIPQLKAVAQALGVPEAGEQVATRVQKDLDYALQVLKDVAPKGEQQVSFAFLYVRGTAGVFFVLGKGSGADDLIQAIGGKDVASEQNATNIIPATSEALVKLNPDVILTMSGGIKSTGGLDGFLARPGVGETNAGKNKRIIDMGDGQILSYGPNTPAVLLSLAKAAYSAPAGAQ